MFEVKISTFAWVSVRVLDALGRDIATLVNEYRQPGVYTLRWNASALPSGVCFCRMQAGDFVETKEMILAK